MRAYVRNTNRQNGSTRVKILILLTVIAVTAGAAFLLTNQKQPTAADAGNAFTAALAEQDAAASYDMLAKDFQATFSEQSWQQWISVTFVRDQAESVRLLSTAPIENLGNVYTPDEQPTRLTYEFTFEEGTFTLPLLLVIENSAWKVSEIGSFE